MPEQQRRAILLREWQGLSYREIAEELEVTQSAVETLIFRARRSLAAGLEQPDSVKKPKRKGFRRALHALDIGTLAAALKTLLAGSAAVKATAAAVAVTAAAGTAYSVEQKVVSNPPVQPAAPAKTQVSKPAPAVAQLRVGLLRRRPCCSFRTEARGQARRDEADERQAGRCGREALGAPALHPGARHTRSACARYAGDPGPGDPGRRRAGVRPSFSARGRAAARRRGQNRQRQARRAGAARGGAGRSAGLGAGLGLAHEGRARHRSAHGDDVSDPRAGGHHESGSGARSHPGPGRPAPVTSTSSTTRVEPVPGSSTD